MGRKARQARIRGAERRSAWTVVERQIERRFTLALDDLQLARARNPDLQPGRPTPEEAEHERAMEESGEVHELLTAPQLRIVFFPSGQPGTFRSYGDELLQAAGEALPPFPLTFYDFGFPHVGDFEVICALVVTGSEFFNSARPDDRWQAIGYLRHRGEDWWTSLALWPEASVQEMCPKVVEEDPSIADAALALKLLTCGALVFCESANVELVEKGMPEYGHRAHGVPHHEAIVRRATKRYVYDEHEPNAVDWSHRWEVAGHFKHFRRGPIFEGNPESHLGPPDDRFVRIWSPPHVKGPADKPLVVKPRRIVVSQKKAA
jgi:hypothetical protein